MVLEHEGAHASRWAAVVSISSKVSAVRRRRCMSGSRRPRSTAANDVPSDVSDRLKALERENRELRQTNEILRKPSAYFAQAEFDCR